ncbi:hypothetical protein D5F01_LYC11466 [Larimichthys crocea]|uniref:Uncharacterized protein n=1 Tax=Larimichthys crocea TaxID=215358 RepID=A0A6G0IEJ5_LARCR|nr:hypothetical protein D5F01_LYC11466 [Larimichthys crocea]
MLTPPQSIPPPPPLPTQSQSSEQEINPPQENAPSESETNSVSSNSILSPPQSIPPLPPIQLLHQPEVVPPNTDDPATQEGVPSPPSEDSIQKGLENSPTEKAQEPAPSQPVIIPVPPPLPVQGLASIKHQPSPASIENQTLELTSAPVVQEEPTPIVTPSILQMVKLRSVNSSPEPPKAQDEPEAEVTMRNQLPRNEVPTSSSSGEPPQKPIRRSLIMTSPVPTSPPACSYFTTSPAQVTVSCDSTCVFIHSPLPYEKVSYHNHLSIHEPTGGHPPEDSSQITRQRYSSPQLALTNITSRLP